MVGRMEGQSVVLRAEKGKLRLLVDDEEEGKSKELVYEVNPKEEKDKKEEKMERVEKEGKVEKLEKQAGEKRRPRGLGIRRRRSARPC